MTLHDGRTIDLVEAIGTGARGTVYRARLTSGWGISRPVAVKILASPANGDIDETMQTIARVARRAVLLRHPSITPVFEIGHTGGDQGLPFVVSELVEGVSLASLMRGPSGPRERPPTDFATVVVLRAAEALDAALVSEGGEDPLVHGDLSTRQILVTDHGDVKIVDFGEHCWRREEEVGSAERIVHRAPEVACGAPPNARSDVFSLGIVLHELLLGPRFAPETSPEEAAELVRAGDIHDRLFEPNLPPRLRDVIGRATAVDPPDRYPHAGEMAFDLRREMLRLGLTDAKTCVHRTLVDRGGGRLDRTGEAAPVRAMSQSDVVPRTAFVRAARPSYGAAIEDTAPGAPYARRGR